MNIGIIGSSGAIGQEIIRLYIYGMLSNVNQITLFFHTEKGKRTLYGIVNDSIISGKYRDINITNDISYLSKTDVVIMCAGYAVPTDIRQINHSGTNNENNRDVLYNLNQKIALEWADIVYGVAPKALFIIVTNPVSRIVADISQRYPMLNVIGCGVTNDTLRVRNELLIEMPHLDASELFVIGEHSLSNQTVALEYFNTVHRYCLKREDFEVSEDHQGSTMISKLKNMQNKALGSPLFINDGYDELPILYRSYFKHRACHFLYKTQISTACAVKEILDAYIYEKTISAEIPVREYLGFKRCVLGIPVKISLKGITPLEIPFSHHELAVLSKCSIKYGGVI